MAAPALLPLPPLPDLEAELAALVRQIPCGMVSTYGALANALGDRQAALWIQRWTTDRAGDETLPVHRVIRADGGLRPVAHDGIPQADRLRSDGVVIEAGRAAAPSFVEFRTTRPLAPLIAWQQEVAERARRLQAPPAGRFVAGLDAAYPQSGRSRVAAVVLDGRSREVVWTSVLETSVVFPYIPGRLVFRELPGLLQGWRAICSAGFENVLTFIDGQGRLHPQRAGLACGFAVATGTMTIGVGKSLLCGRHPPLEAGDVLAPVAAPDGELLGNAVLATPQSRPFYVSVGGGLTQQEAVARTLEWLDGHRLPRPIRLADRLSKRAPQEVRGMSESNWRGAG